VDTSTPLEGSLIVPRQEIPAMVVAEVELLLRSLDASWCFEKWARLPDDGNRYEIIDGVLYMSTSPNVRHQRSVMRLDRHVGIAVEERGVAIALSSPIGVFMPGADPVQPDFLLVRTERAEIIEDEGHVHGVPDLIAEVLSPRNPQLDTQTKRAAYARAGVPEYWMLRPATRDVLVCTRPDPALSDYTAVHLCGADEELISPTLPIRVSVTVLFEGRLNPRP
jgi:Uma2 family endonuclease